jgi:hypothetical protein
LTLPLREIKLPINYQFDGEVMIQPLSKPTLSGMLLLLFWNGNADGEWGEGRAIIEGAGLLGPWRKAGRTPKA